MFFSEISKPFWKTSFIFMATGFAVACFCLYFFGHEIIFSHSFDTEVFVLESSARLLEITGYSAAVFMFGIILSKWLLKKDSFFDLFFSIVNLFCQSILLIYLIFILYINA